MKIAMSSGHAKDCPGASGFLDEVTEARRLVEAVATEMRELLGVQVAVFHDDVSDDQSENLNRIVDWHDAQSRDLDVSIHFNSTGDEPTDQPIGTECLYLTQEDLAARVSAAIAEAAELPDRGAKYRDDLAFLNNTDMPAILIETCFVNSSFDADRYRWNFDAISQAIAEAITGVTPEDDDGREFA